MLSNILEIRVLAACASSLHLFAALLTLIPLQMVASELFTDKELGVDQPHARAQAVTVE